MPSVHYKLYKSNDYNTLYVYRLSNKQHYFFSYDLIYKQIIAEKYNDI